MYFNKYPSIYEPEKQIKCSKIFRPWDCADDKTEIASCTRKCEITRKLDDSAQDATVSTTTENEDNDTTLETAKSLKSSAEDSKVSRIPVAKSLDAQKPAKKLQTRPEKPQALNQQSLHERRIPQDGVETLPATLLDYPGNLEGYPLYPDYLHVNLAHSLGLTPTDPLFLECVSQGCTLEEYTRVLSQEHQAKILSARKQRPKKYRCPHCDVGFSNNGQLKGHIRIHTGERPFRCDEGNCGKTFTRNEELTRHKRIHSGLRPFPCTHCGKRFGRKDHLKKHSRTHFQPRGLYALPVVLPFETWTSSAAAYPYVPMFTY